jgi:hypothetical protein
MRKSEVSGSMVTSSYPVIVRAARLSAIAFGIGLLLVSGIARAQEAEDQDDDKTFEEKIIDKLMRGAGATNMETPTIEYRERSPLVVPPKLDLPPPAAGTQAAPAPNWPKDPDVQRRAAAAAARKKENKDPTESARPLTPAEMKMGKTAKSKTNEPMGVASSSPTMLSPSQLGSKIGLFGMFKGGSDSPHRAMPMGPGPRSR